MAANLRLLNYLSPGLPTALFEGIAEYLEQTLGLEVALFHESRFSGPPPDAANPFVSGQVDAAFMCAPPFFWSLEAGVPVELLGVAPIFDDPRTQRKPVYFSDSSNACGQCRKNLCRASRRGVGVQRYVFAKRLLLFARASLHSRRRPDVFKSTHPFRVARGVARAGFVRQSECGCYRLECAAAYRPGAQKTVKNPYELGAVSGTAAGGAYGSRASTQDPFA